MRNSYLQNLQNTIWETWRNTAKLLDCAAVSRVRFIRDTVFHTILSSALLQPLISVGISRLVHLLRPEVQKLHLSPLPEVSASSNSHSRDYYSADLRSHCMLQNRHQLVRLITATPLFAPFGATSREECVYTWTSGLPSGDMIAPSRSGKPQKQKFRKCFHN